MSSVTRFPACVGAFAAELDAIHRVLRRQGVPAADAEDLAQEVFLVMWRRWPDYDPARPLRPWVLGIAIKVARAHRKQPRREVLAGLIETAADPRPPPDQALAEGRARALVRAALLALPDKQRSVLVLHDLEGVAMVDIAGARSEPLTTLYSRLVTARRAFARAVRRLGRGATLAGPAVGRSSGDLLALERPDPPSPEARARILRRARAVVVAPGSGWAWQSRTQIHRKAEKTGRRADGSHPGAAGGACGPGGRGVALAGGAGAVALLAGTLLLALPSRPPAQAGSLGLRSGPPAARADRGRATRPPRPTPAAVLPAPITAEHPARAGLGRGLVGYWRFDEAPGSVAARDLSGHGTDCLLRGLDPATDWVAGRLAGAVNLSGQGWLECPDPRFGAGPELTVAAWVKRTRAQRGLRVLATRQLGDGPRDHFFFGFDGERIGLASHVWNGTLRHPLPVAPLHHWVHLAAVHRDGRVEIYVDGVRVAGRKSYRGRQVAAAAPLLIGAGVNGADPRITSQRLAAAVDELVVHGRALSDAEIAALADGVQPPAVP
jgi:RNA polymerase sigma-70 factor, ECF subfamily